MKIRIQHIASHACSKHGVRRTKYGRRQHTYMASEAASMNLTIDQTDSYKYGMSVPTNEKPD